jgi:hypothetical protein
MNLFDRLILPIALLSFVVFMPNKVKAEEFQPLTGEQIKTNPNLCVPIVGQSQNNGVVVNQVVGNNCQAYINGAFNLEAVREQEKTKKNQFETNAKMNLFQLLMSMPKK